MTCWQFTGVQRTVGVIHVCTQRRRGTEGYDVLAIYRCAEN
ncbi:MAG: hypothetical protein RLZZ332_552, partial [Actinomycetota bacterium]